MKVNRKLKAVIQNFLSFLPKSYKWNYLFQRYINKSFPEKLEMLDMKMSFKRQHLTAFGGEDWDFDINGSVYEFGAGYNLAISLFMWDEGFRQQVVTDLTPLAKIDLINFAIEFSGIDIEFIKDFNDLYTRIGIKYIPNVNASDTGFKDLSFNYVHSTVTLEHIPKNDILPILQECYRVLKAGGIISCIIDLQDHYHYADDSISPFDFYQYSWQEWNKKYNNKLQYQNRLLASEYYTMFAQAGFAPIQMQVTKASDAQIDELKNLNLHPDFATKPIDELSNLFCHIWAEKPD